MNINGLTILMFVFGLGILLAGLYLFTGHDSELLLWKDHKKHHSKEELRTIGKWTMISSIIPFIVSIISLFLDV